MALTNEELTAEVLALKAKAHLFPEDRLKAIEVKLNEVQTAMNNLATKRQMKGLLNIRQSEIEDLKTRVAALEAQVAALQA
jgi:polyhydroxyalkanoate synthesis regulator phasin